MKNNVKRLISLMLILATLLSMGLLPVNAVDTTVPETVDAVVPETVDAVAPETEDAAAPEKAAEEAQNPLYTRHVPLDAMEEPNEDTLMDSLSATYYGLRDSAALFRDAMIQRKTTVYLYVRDPETSITFSDIFELALSEELATSATAGDYLKWSWSGYSASWDYVSNGNWILTVQMSYYTTSSQESWFRNRLTSVMNSLPLSGKTTYEKYKTIYKYVCDNVNYDYAGLDAIEDDYTYNDDYSIFTAYGCLWDGTAVCQGYACLFYAMCRTAGIPVRIVTSVDHAWNIVKLDNIWYSVDSTWDGETSVTTYDWFLLGSRSFDPSHPREAGYEDFPTTHPHSKYDYHACSGSHTYETRKTTKQPTCTATGTKADICYYCGRSYNVTTIAALGHNYKLTVNQAATSTEAGYKQYTCSRCSHSYYTGHVPATGTGNPFIDVHSGSFYYNPVQWANQNGITSGTSSMEFSPEAACTRGQVVTFLWRAAGKPEPKSTSHPFTDVSSKAFYYKAMLWAVENGITSGTSKTTFSPNDPCTRGQVVTFLYRAAGKPAVTNTFHNFTDVKSGAFYYKAMLWAVQNGITSGTSKTEFSPDKACTRGQVVTFLYRYYG